MFDNYLNTQFDSSNAVTDDLDWLYENMICANTHVKHNATQDLFKTGAALDIYGSWIKPPL